MAAKQFPKHKLDKVFKEQFGDRYGDNAKYYIRIGWNAAAKYMFDLMNQDNA